MQTIITISNVDTNEYFFSTDHCQPHNLGDNWVSCTHTLPIKVAERPLFPTGWIYNKEDFKKILYYHRNKEIPNPDPKYQG